MKLCIRFWNRSAATTDNQMHSLPQLRSLIGEIAVPENGSIHLLGRLLGADCNSMDIHLVSCEGDTSEIEERRGEKQSIHGCAPGKGGEGISILLNL